MIRVNWLSIITTSL